MAASSATRRGNGAGHGPANGSGWGGPKRGAHDSRGDRATPFTAASAEQALQDNLDPSEQAFRADRRSQRRAKRETDEARSEEIKDRLFNVAMGLVPTATPVEMQAAREFMDRALGKPIQTTITASVDDAANLSDDELRAELARLGGTALGAAAGGREAPDTD